MPQQGYAYQVPYRSILPKPEQCENLLVPVALSCTHVGISSLRIEGTWMVIGQSAGIAAALSVKKDVPVQELPYANLRERLLAQGQVLQLPAQRHRKTNEGDPESWFAAFSSREHRQTGLFFRRHGQ